jgi:malonate transporter MadL subunit
MIIYGVALLAICTLAGVILGDMLGVLLGVKSNVGGVGIAMILLICARLWMQKRGGMVFGAPCTSRWWSPWPRSRTWSPPCAADRLPYWRRLAR